MGTTYLPVSFSREHLMLFSLLLMDVLLILQDQFDVIIDGGLHAIPEVCVSHTRTTQACVINNILTTGPFHIYRHTYIL